MDNSCRQWEHLVIFIKSLGQRVPAEWVAKDIKTKLNLKYKLEVFPIAKDHLILRFKSSKDYAMALKGGLWFVAGQLLAMEP